MSDNPTAPFTGAGDATAKVRATETVASGVIQHVRLDLGAGVAEAQATGSIPVTVAPAALASAPNVEGLAVVVGTGLAVVVLASFASRKQATLIPEGDVYMRLGGTATAANAKLPAYTPYNIAGYAGSVSMLSVAGTVNVNVWEF